MLVNFTRELERTKDQQDYHLVWRYARAGRLPKLLYWLVEHPTLLSALLEDAKERDDQNSTDAVA